MPYKCTKPVIDLSVRQLCLKPYPNHKKGCPNNGKKKGCPPNCPTIMDIIDLTQPTYFVWNIFDFAGHCERMRKKHPQWSRRQIECCLYWQPKARKQLTDEIIQFQLKLNTYYLGYNAIYIVPEALGVNVTATMKNIGIDLEWPPKTKAYQVALVGKYLK